MKTCIKVLPSDAYDTPEKRKALAVMVATIVNVGLTENVPYLPTPGNDFKWAVDSGNDWLLEFDINDFRIFSLTHRYGNDKITTAIMAFIAYRLHAYVLTAIKIDLLPTMRI